MSYSEISFEIEQVAEDIYRVPVPLPGSPLVAVNSYFVLGPDKTTIVDVGVNNPACEQALNEALEKLGRSWESVELVLTHSHPDHTGNIDRIWRPWMRVYAGLSSFQEVKNLMDIQATVFNPLLSHLVEPGQYDERDVQARDCTRFGISNSMIPVKNQPVLCCLHDGDIYRNGNHYFKVIHTPGHDDWQICLYEPQEKLLISGDHILERITPTIMSWINGYDALREYLNSLDTVRDLDVERILPGHGPIFTGLAERVDYMKQHHLDRLEELYQLVLEGHTSIIDIARSAKWKHPNWDEWTLDQKWFSMGETLAHLIYLVNEGRIILTIRQNKRRFYASTLWDSHTR